jgi:hypothetical protein
MQKQKKNKPTVFEKKHHALAPKRVYYKRLLVSFLTAVAFLSLSLVIGIFGYHILGKLSWMDALVNASMILGGMGPVDQIHSNNGKVFTSIYAIYSGVSFLTAFSILIAPALHRLMHKFHLSDDKE